jgi:hypothetical protein
MIRVYHGSNVAVETPLTGIGRKAVDFGEGFYVTALQSQAEVWARNKARYHMQPEGTVSLYDFDLDAAKAEYRFHKFEQYDREWLHFIVSCRRGGEEWRQWDIIEGGVANDRVIDTVENYMAGLIPEEIALGLLSQHQPNHQICITRQEVVDRYMHFVESIQVNAYAE